MYNIQWVYYKLFSSEFEPLINMIKIIIFYYYIFNN